MANEKRAASMTSVTSVTASAAGAPVERDRPASHNVFRYSDPPAAPNGLRHMCLRFLRRLKRNISQNERQIP